MRRLITLARHPASRKRLVIEALVSLLSARMRVWRHGQHAALRACGYAVPIDHTGPESAVHRLVAGDVGWAVGALAPSLRSPGPCLVQALAASQMLTRRGVPWVLTVSVARGASTDLIAHAWLRSSGRIVTGQQGLRGLTPLASYAGPACKDHDHRG
jgi:hypothetical protein